MKLTREHWILLGVLAFALLVGGTAVVIYKKKEIEDALWVAFDAAGLPGEWGRALGDVESQDNMLARVLTGTDGARGGAWGPTQITERTARAHGYTGPMEAMNTDLATAAGWTARIAAAGNPQTIEDLGAWWNGGYRRFTSLPSDHVTRLKYVPRLVAAYERIAS